MMRVQTGICEKRDGMNFSQLLECLRATPTNPQEQEAANGRGRARSAKTGRYVTRATAARHPKSTVIEAGGNKGSGTRSRSAITGRFVTPATARRHPGSTVTENG